MTRAVLTIACLFLLGTSMALADNDTLWTRRYDGQGRRDDFAKIVLVDNSDNVFVVGTGLGAGSGQDVEVVKYSSEGDVAWFATVAGPGAYNDEAKGAALDADGNIYITASSGLYPDFDILTVELPAAGGPEIWRRTWAGAGAKADVPAGIVVDGAGNAYVTGYTTAANGLTDWVTMKHLPGTGLPAWVVVRNGEGGGMDAPAAIVLGPDASIYITGYSQRLHLEDYATVKYNTAGVEQWAQFYNYSGNGPDFATAIAVDGDGDAYVTGRSATAPPPGGVYQYATIKYDDSDSGAQVWVQRYAGQGGPTQAVAIALGTDVVYVTGSTASSGGTSDFATLEYNQDAGTQGWATTFDGVGKADDPVGIAVLPYGDILVFGTSVDLNDKGDYYITRYTATGADTWAQRYNSPVDNDEIAASVTYDSHSNPIVTGSSFMSGYYDFLTVKYDSSAGGGITEFKPVVPRRSGMRLSPNPARSWTNVEHSLSGTAPAIVSLLGVDGRMVRTQRFDGQAGASSRLDLTGLAPGVYVARLESGGRSATQKLVVQQ